ncbi:MAG: agmatinase [Methanobacteriota archaeon]|nr:MAG: agmatinase [Euryarchaeota archaeon]
MPESLFADANSSLEEARFAIFGVPFDKTSSFRSGSAQAPDKIREASHNFETYMFEHGEDIESIKYCDLGNLEEFEDVSSMIRGVEEFTGGIVEKGKIPIVLGGEHSLTPGVVKCLDDIGVIVLDAHLDFRDEYEDEKFSHCSTVRRISDSIGVKSVVPIGVRSFSKEEEVDAEELGLRFITSYELSEKTTIQEALEMALRWIDKDKIYLSLDMDIIDPAFAPGISNPEPFGLAPIEIKKCINYLAGRLVGFDVVEVSPPFDNGNTSALAARLVRETIMATWKAQT